MAIFGSFVRNEQTEDSDLDILVDFKDTIGIQFILRRISKAISV